MYLLIHDVEKRERGGENKDVRGGEQAQEPNELAFVRFGLDGGGVHGLVES